LEQVEANRDSLLDTVETMRDYVRIMDHKEFRPGDWLGDEGQDHESYTAEGEQPW
jgi:hypothetical protein